MNFKLKSCDVFSWEKVKGGMFQLKNDFEAVWLDNEGLCYHFYFSRGALWDGASIPKMFRWYLPNIDEKNLVYTLAGLVHDACYGSELLDKDTSDDLFRGTMRDAGIPRRKASFAEWCVEHFAKSHYGRKNDRYGIRLFVRMEKEKTA